MRLTVVERASETGAAGGLPEAGSVGGLEVCGV